MKEKTECRRGVAKALTGEGETDSVAGYIDPGETTENT